MSEFEQHIRNSYKKVEPYARHDGVYKSFEAFFDVGTPGGQPGSFCYSDEEGYHLGVVDVRGNISTNIATQSLFEITYQVLHNYIFWMSFEYERNNRIEEQDNRRVMFDKMLEYWGVIGNKFSEREQQKINEALEGNPFVDEVLNL